MTGIDNVNIESGETPRLERRGLTTSASNRRKAAEARTNVENPASTAHQATHTQGERETTEKAKITGDLTSNTQPLGIPPPQQQVENQTQSPIEIPTVDITNQPGEQQETLGNNTSKGDKAGTTTPEAGTGMERASTSPTKVTSASNVPWLEAHVKVQLQLIKKLTEKRLMKEDSLIGIEEHIAKQTVPHYLRINFKPQVEQNRKGELDRIIRDATWTCQKTVLEGLAKIRKEELENLKAQISQAQQDIQDDKDNLTFRLSERGVEGTPPEIEICMRDFHRKCNEVINQATMHHVTKQFAREAKVKAKRTAALEQEVNNELDSPEVANLREQLKTLQQSVEKLQKGKPHQTRQDKPQGRQMQRQQPMQQQQRRNKPKASLSPQNGELQLQQQASQQTKPSSKSQRQRKLQQTQPSPSKTKRTQGNDKAKSSTKKQQDGGKKGKGKSKQNSKVKGKGKRAHSKQRDSEMPEPEKKRPKRGSTSKAKKQPESGARKGKNSRDDKRRKSTRRKERKYESSSSEGSSYQSSSSSNGEERSS